jgi:hypothetical protein
MGGLFSVLLLMLVMINRNIWILESISHSSLMTRLCRAYSICSGRACSEAVGLGGGEERQ